MTLFGGNKLHVAVFTDFHTGQKGKVRRLRESGLLKEDHVLSAEMYVDQDEADIEDLLGRSLYITLVNKCYSLGEQDRLPEARPSSASARVLKEVEDHFATLPPDIPQLDHCEPALFLMENTTRLRAALPNLDEALDRFEKLFKELNGLLPQ